MEKNTNILLLECFMRGETSPDEEQILSDWLHSQEAKEQLSNYYQETWKGSNNKLIAEVQGRMFERAKSNVDAVSVRTDQDYVKALLNLFAKRN